MSPLNPDPDAPLPSDEELLELHLDGQLMGSLADEADRRLADDPGWRREADLQQRIDASLKRQFEPPAVDPEFLKLLAAGGEPPAAIAAEPAPATVPFPATPSDALSGGESDKGRASSLWQNLAAVAALFLVAGGLWVYQTGGDLGGLLGGSDPYKERTVTQIYRRGVGGGFQPDWLCKDDKQFAETFYERQGEGLLLEPLPEGIQIAGLAYWEGLTEKATCLLSRVDGEPVLVMVARTNRLPEHLLESDPARGLTVFTQELGRLTIIEATPLAEPRLTPHLYLADVPKAPTGRVPGSPR